MSRLLLLVLLLLLLIQLGTLSGLHRITNAGTSAGEEAAFRTADNNAGRRLRAQLEADIHAANIGVHEPLLSSLLPGLLRESADADGLVPEGGIFDVGAQFGEMGAHYAIAAPERRALLMDPSPARVASIQKKFGDLPNLRILQGGVGKEPGMMKPRDSSFGMDMDTEFQIYTLDSLFYDKGERLALLHLDVEGLELDALKGGAKTIQAYRPIMTTEVRVHQDPAYTAELLDFLADAGYDSYVIEEPCGYPHMDFRNLLNVPRERSTALLGSDAIATLFAVDAIMRVEARGDVYTSVFEVVLPCCKLGGECCPGDDIHAASCCSEDRVRAWAQKNGVKRPDAMVGWRAGKISYGKYHYRIHQRQLHGNSSQLPKVE